MPVKGLAHLTIGGSAAARGKVTLTVGGVLRGRLGGKRVTVHLAAQALAGARATAADLRAQRFEPFASSLLPGY